MAIGILKKVSPEYVLGKAFYPKRKNLFMVLKFQRLKRFSSLVPGRGVCVSCWPLYAA